ncbi:MAG: D-alanyl-D-alanine carboxypeptidase/D-alanyl-D-alanine-endopeptidase, partial [Gemmatimonadota bacterium]|nr:D-alanyl-D-alanine carboxypeptidase/D-alanyl-D-alanine-endopeptidase [Gemmatimonadota bacterium]
MLRVFQSSVLALALFLAPLPSDAQNRPPLQGQAEAIVGRSGEQWGVMAWSVDRNVPLFAIDSEDLRIPASNNKVFTAIWALDMLGPDYRFPTDVALTAPIRNGTVQGDVVLRGSGDPAFGYPEFTSETMDPLRIMARQLHARGVRVVEGGVIADGTVFSDSLFGPEWPRDTGNGVSRYAPRVSGLPFQRNMMRVQAFAEGGQVRIETTPRTTQIPVVSNARVGSGRGWAVRAPDQDTIRVRGSISGRGPHRYEIGVAQPALMAGEALRQALEEVGIQVRQPTRLGATPREAYLVHRHWSIRLADMIPKLNRDSDNFFAEHLWKAAAARSIGIGSYTRGGTASAIFFAERTGLPYGQIWMADGSGLSRQNHTSAHALVAALVYAHKRPWTEVFHQSMAVGGDPNGTLRRLFRGSPASGNLHAKTGYINNVRTLSGYVRARNGELIAFSFLFNGNNTSGARGVQEQLGVLLAEYAGSAPAAA